MAEHFAVTLIKAIFQAGKVGYKAGKRSADNESTVGQNIRRGAGAGMTAAARKETNKVSK